jgi:hypothetical protein
LASFLFSGVAAQETERPDPYIPGESLSYVGKYKRFGLSFAIAEIDFRVTEKKGDGNYVIRTQGKSKGTLSKLFNFKFLLKIDSIADGSAFNVFKTTKRDEQGDRVRDSEAEFDYGENQVTYVETDPNNPTAAPRRIASSITEDTQDIVTSVYKLRSLDLAVGKSFVVKVSDSGLVYDVPVRVTARERKKSELGKRWCWRVEPEVFGDGKLIEQKGKMTIWITDDEDRVPVLAKLNTKYGGVEIKLRGYSNLRSSKTLAK